MSVQPFVAAVQRDSQFRVCCEAPDERRFAVEIPSFSLKVGQCIRRGDNEEMWASLGVYAERDQEGTLVVRVVVFNPDWDRPLQIASIKSRPSDAGCLTPIGCNLDHVASGTEHVSG